MNKSSSFGDSLGRGIGGHRGHSGVTDLGEVSPAGDESCSAESESVHRKQARPSTSWVTIVCGIVSFRSMTDKPTTAHARGKAN